MKTVIWSQAAELDLADIVDFIAIDNLTAAMELAQLIVSAVENNLPDQPHMGRPGRAHGTRELVVHKNYIVIYRATESQIQVLAVMHAARFFPANG
ncbi:type II toxin-antitoxin system RelE/ParE family toxin [Algirhabdus cladophorae]|uniref:type II toxin-antitoxin system RelE/ParE family toxin n=1 Tax=Algirhabdus cladophorae TaxID=3377108 RepID=UPI003B848E13